MSAINSLEMPMYSGTMGGVFIVLLSFRQTFFGIYSILRTNPIATSTAGLFVPPFFSPHGTNHFIWKRFSDCNCILRLMILLSVCKLFLPTKKSAWLNDRTDMWHIHQMEICNYCWKLNPLNYYNGKIREDEDTDACASLDFFQQSMKTLCMSWKMRFHLNKCCDDDDPSSQI